MLPPQERIRILLDETRRLENYLSRLPVVAWSHPSSCDRWTVADVVAHLTWLGKNYPARINRALQGDASPDTPAHRRLASGQLDPAEEGDQAISLRQELGDHLLSEFLKGNQAINQTLAAVGPQDWDKLVYRGVGTEPLRNLVDVFITEQTLHGWDIRSRFDPQASLSPDCVPIIVERIAQRPRWWSFKKGTSPLPLRYRFEVANPTPYSVDLVITGEGRADHSTVFNKAPVGVARRALAQGVPTLLLAGGLGPGHRELYQHGIAAMVCIADGPMSFRQSLSRTAELLEGAAERALRLMGVGAKSGAGN